MEHYVTFTMDAFPGTTYFEPTRKVLCAMQIIDENVAGNTDMIPVFPHAEEEGDIALGVDDESGAAKDTDSTSVGK